MLFCLQEYYAYIDDESNSGSRKLGFFAWLYCCMAFVETAVIIKFSRGMFPAPWPAHILWFWGVVSSTFTIVMAVWVLRRHSAAEQQKAKAA